MTYVSRSVLQQDLLAAKPNALLAWMSNGTSREVFEEGAWVRYKKSDDGSLIDRVELEPQGAVRAMDDILIRRMYQALPEIYWVTTPEENLERETLHAEQLVRCLFVAAGADPYGYLDRADECGCCPCCCDCDD